MNWLFDKFGAWPNQCVTSAQNTVNFSSEISNVFTIKAFLFRVSFFFFIHLIKWIFLGFFPKLSAHSFSSRWSRKWVVYCFASLFLKSNISFDELEVRKTWNKRVYVAFHHMILNRPFKWFLLNLWKSKKKSNDISTFLTSGDWWTKQQT